MGEILSVPVQEAKNRLDDEQLIGFKKAYESFYGVFQSNRYGIPVEFFDAISLIYKALDKLPHNSDESKDLAVKLYQTQSFLTNFQNNTRWEEIRILPDKDIINKERLLEEIIAINNSIEVQRRLLNSKYGADL